SAVTVGTGLLVLMILGRGLGARRTVVGVVAVAVSLVMPWTANLAASRPAVSQIVALDAQVTDAARIVGIEQRQQAYAPGETVQVTGLWQATAWTPADLQSGLRLTALGSDATLTEYWDRPNLGRTPTAKWVLGELVPDDFSLRVPAGTPPGSYRL